MATADGQSSEHPIDDGDVVGRLARLEAMEEVRALVARYGAEVDAKNPAGVAGLFATDGVFVIPDGEVRGRSTIEAFYRERMTRYAFTFHYTHDVLFIEVGAASVVAEVSAHAEHEIDSSCYVAAITYHDRYAREAGRWRFAVRTVRFRYFLPASAYTGGFTGRAIIGRPTEVSAGLLSDPG